MDTRDQMAIACHNAAAGRLRFAAQELLRKPPGDKASYDRMMAAAAAHDDAVARIQAAVEQ